MADNACASFIWALLAASLASSLSGCGDDDDAAATPIVPEPRLPLAETTTPPLEVEADDELARVPNEQVVVEAPPEVPPAPSGPSNSVEEAAFDGLVDVDDEWAPGTEVHGIEERPRHTWIAFTVAGLTPDFTIANTRRDPPPRVSLYLALVRNPSHDDDPYVRERMVKLYDYAVTGYANQCDNMDFDGESELRIRDIDGDGEVEAQVIASVAAIIGPKQNGQPVEECGRVAFIVGADMRVQAQFTREYHSALVDAGGETYLSVQTRWRLEDQDRDGHNDLHVIESYDFRSDFSGDYAGEGYGTVPGHRRRGSNRRSVDCPYDEDADVWVCPNTPVIGQQFFRPRPMLDEIPRAPEDPGW